MLSLGQFGSAIGNMLGFGRPNPNAAIQKAQNSAAPGMLNMGNMFKDLSKQIGVGTVGTKSFTAGNLGMNPATANKVNTSFKKINTANPMPSMKAPKMPKP